MSESFGDFGVFRDTQILEPAKNWVLPTIGRQSTHLFSKHQHLLPRWVRCLLLGTCGATVDGSEIRLHNQLRFGSLSHYLQGFFTSFGGLPGF